MKYALPIHSILPQVPVGSVATPLSLEI